MKRGGNLYAFISLSGLVLFLSCAWLTVSEYSRIRAHFWELLHSNTLSSPTINYESIPGNIAEPESDKPARNFSRLELEKQLFKDSKKHIKDLHQGQNLGKIMFLVGIALWYFKVQRYQDRRARLKGQTTST